MNYNIRKPSITAPSEQGQLLQIKSYLIQLVDQIIFALNDISKKTGGTSAAETASSTGRAVTTTELELKLNALKSLITAGDDYVIEKGNKDGWTYRKWAGGTYEMFGTFSALPAFSEVNGTLYRTDDIKAMTPFPITDDAIITGMAPDNYWMTNGAYVNENIISIRIMCDKEIGTEETVKVRLHVTGTYAQTEDKNGNG